MDRDAALRQAMRIRAGTDPAWENARTIIVRAASERKLWAEVIEKTGMKVE